MYPLHKAIETDNIELATSLLSTGHSVNDPDEHELTPLHFARSVDAAQLLVIAGADTNARDEGGQTPLHAAVIDGRDEVASFLFRNGADPNLFDTNGQSPVDLAVEAFNVDPFARQTTVFDGITDPLPAFQDALYQAAMRRDERRVELLLDQHRELYGDPEQIAYAKRPEFNKDNDALGKFPYSSKNNFGRDLENK
jgi:ankyrin repeat protein